MGNTESYPTEHYDRTPIFDGYRVLGVQPSSPASKAGLVSFFDFIVGCHGELFVEHNPEHEEEEVDFSHHVDTSPPSSAISCREFVDAIALSQAQDKALSLVVHNIKSGRTREVIVTPRKGGLIEDGGWGGNGMLGVTIRPDDYRGAIDRLLRVLDVQVRCDGFL
mmetsp:Transcript_19199/g.43732  ORF Transcript_19199/g.43732 Transcript_19199/m.43732 type:complete len:165 (-) Transcript_19199:293-787(-)